WRTLIREIAPLPIFIPWGNATEYARAKRLSHDFSHAKLLPKMTLSELAYLISHATLVISLDTGLSHMAAALGTPCITLYGPTDPQRVGTKGDHQVWLTSLGTLSPTQVLKAARQWIPSLSLP
ncbi:MAG: lipopolysaccharide heptosyltransferase 1, partial [Chlamydiae bacterium]|nr:lipopolysaccharide heptosyltransferase 1 [Chlamydiota bacterium]